MSRTGRVGFQPEFAPGWARSAGAASSVPRAARAARLVVIGLASPPTGPVQLPTRRRARPARLGGVVAYPDMIPSERPIAGPVEREKRRLGRRGPHIAPIRLDLGGSTPAR